MKFKNIFNTDIPLFNRKAEISPKIKPTLEANGGAQTITAKIITQAVDLSRKDIKRWRQALDEVNDTTRPRRVELQYIYQYLLPDGHLQSQIQLRKLATIATRFIIVDKAGKEDTEKTKLLQTAWFQNFVSDALDSVYFGHTLLELVDIESMTFKLIPRENVVPEHETVLLNVNDDKGIVFTDEIYNKWLIEVGQRHDIGMLNNIVQQLIWKKNAQHSWAEFAERFGFPFVYATTTSRDKKTLDTIETQLKALGEASGGVFPKGTGIDMKEASRSDAYNVYDRLIERANTEISKQINGGTMLSDNGASRSQSEVHERNLDEKIAEADHRLIEFTVNNQLLPILMAHGFKFSEDDKFMFDRSESIYLNELWNIVNQLMYKYDIDMDWISKTFNIPIKGERKQQQQIQEPPARNNSGASSSIQGGGQFNAEGVNFPNY